MPGSRIALLTLLLVVAAGCGDQEQPKNDAGDGRVNALSVGFCLGQNGYPLDPSQSGVRARTPGGQTFTITFYGTPRLAQKAAGTGATAVDNVVVTSQRPLPRTALATIQRCLHEND